MLKPFVRRLILPVLASALTLVGCGALLPSLGIPTWQPAGANAGTAERAAKNSVPAAAAVNQAAQLAELVPGVSVPATVVDRFTAGYLASIQASINELDKAVRAHEQDPAQPAPSQHDWWIAMALATAAGGSNVLSFKHGQKNPGGAA